MLRAKLFLKAFLVALIVTLIAIPCSEAKGKKRVRRAKSQKSAPSLYKPKTKINFEDLLIQGQTKKADTVYLFERGESKQKSLVKKRESFRKEIYEEMFQ
jgi:hypothetical protein